MFKYNHNEHYADLLMRQAPPHCHDALDIGCGDGGFARKVANSYGIPVIGIDRDQPMIERACAETQNPDVQFVEADFLHYNPDHQFDFITATASIHHMPFEPALEKMASLLRPGGVLAVLGLYHKASVTDTAIELVAIPVNVIYALRRGWYYSGAPIKDVDMSLREIRDGVTLKLPGAHIRRLLLWRYLLTWRKPAV